MIMIMPAITITAVTINIKNKNKGVSPGAGAGVDAGVGAVAGGVMVRAGVAGVGVTASSSFFVPLIPTTGGFSVGVGVVGV